MREKLILAISILTLSQAGNIIRLCDAPPVTVAFYRLIIAFVVLFPIACFRLKKRFFTIERRALLQIILMGTLFAFHFFTWIEAIQNTTVANAAICFSIAPVLTAFGAYFFFKEIVTKGAIVAMVSGIIGVALTGMGDLSFSPAHLYGDFMGILAAIFFALYFLTGKKLQGKSEYFSIMPIVYIAGAFVSAVVMGVSDLSFSGFSNGTWVAMGALGIFPTIIGHGLLIYSLKFFKSSTVSTLTLVEPVFAAIVALIAFGEGISLFATIGYGVIVCGLLYMFNGPRALATR